MEFHNFGRSQKPIKHISALNSQILDITYLNYCIDYKYWDTLTSYHLVLNFERVSLVTFLCV